MSNNCIEVCPLLDWAKFILKLPDGIKAMIGAADAEVLARPGDVDETFDLNFQTLYDPSNE
jgi:hypothetical protein